MATIFNIAKSAFARERLTCTNASLALTAATYSDAANPGSRRGGARGALVSVLTAPIFYALVPGGSAPTNDATVAGVGIPAAIGAQIVLETLEQVTAFRAIRNGAVDAVLEIVYFR